MKSTLRTHPAMLAVLLVLSGPGATPATTPDDDPHAAVACSACHLGSAARARAVSTAGAGDPRSRTCRECHRGLARRDRTAAGLGFHADPQADCTGCHAFHEPGRLKTAVGDVRAGSGGLARAVPGHCAACHADGSVMANLSSAHRTAASLYHRDAGALAEVTPSQGCLNCHAAGSGSPWLRETDGQTLTFNLHATHPLGVEVVAGSGRDERRLRPDLDPRLPLFSGKIECQTCHSLTAATADLLVPFAQPYDLCLGCHQLRNGKPAPAPEALMATMIAVE